MIVRHRHHTGSRNSTADLEPTGHRKMDIRFGTLNIRSLYGAGTIGLVTSELDMCRMDLVGVQEVRWEGSGTLESGIRNVLTRRREYGTYLATARRHRRRIKMQKRDE